MNRPRRADPPEPVPPLDPIGLPSTGAGFDPDRALRLLRRIAFPRAVGSPGERLAARLVGRALARSGRPVASERFPVGTTARRVGSLLAFLGAAVLASIGLALAARWPWPAALCALAAGGLVNAPWVVTRSLVDRFRARTWSENLVAWPAESEARDEEGPPRVVFLAHYDSKSQRLPTGIRVALVVAVTIGCAAMAVAATAAAILPSLAFPGTARVGLAVLLNGCLISLMCNASGNRSPGALDNGSGLAVLLELARSWRPRPGAPAEAAFLATGAEEVGLDGARAFLQRHEWWLRERPTLLINLESVGAGRRVWLAGSAPGVAMAEGVASAAGIPTSRLRVLGAGMDHQPFAAAGLDAVSLLGDVVGTSGSLHSPRDDLRLIDREALARAARLAALLAWSWADWHASPLCWAASGPAAGGAGGGGPDPRPGW